jgi:hypothetical protein
MDIQRFTSEDSTSWDAFVEASRNGTFYHTRRFLSSHPNDRFSDHSLLFFEKGKLVAVLPGALKEDGGVKHFVSHPGSTHGGLVLSRDHGAATTYDIVATFLTHLREEGMQKASFLRLTPLPCRREASDDQEYALLQQGFHLSRMELGSVVTLSGLMEDTILKSFDTECRNEVRQAERAGVEVRECKEYEAFWPILSATLEHRHKVRPTHDQSELVHFAKLFPGDVKLFGAFSDGKFIAGIVTVALTEHAVYVKYMAQDYEHQKKRPMNLLLTEVMRWCLRTKKTILDLGVSMEEGSPSGINEGLFAFKEGFGARSVRRQSFTIDL